MQEEAMQQILVGKSHKIATEWEWQSALSSDQNKQMRVNQSLQEKYWLEFL